MNPKKGFKIIKLQMKTKPSFTHPHIKEDNLAIESVWDHIPIITTTQFNILLL